MGRTRLPQLLLGCGERGRRKMAGGERQNGFPADSPGGLLPPARAARRLLDMRIMARER